MIFFWSLFHSYFVHIEKVLKKRIIWNKKLDNSSILSSLQENLRKLDEKFGKRIRLEFTEKNILMESERRECEQEVMESQTEPPSCCSGQKLVLS